ncbi:MAG: diheme cytochrome c-553 [Bacteroidota bacterium]|nr:diheme cytochrome c-553 [Bacteroidota bacterium]
MKKKILNSLVFLTFLAIIIAGCRNAPKTQNQVVTTPTQEQLVQRGLYLVTIGGCNDCHSPKKMGPQGPEVIPELMLSGYPGDRPVEKPDVKVIKKGWNLLNSDFTAAAGMWGMSFSGNLTSDQTGIGNWTEENFRRALKEGKYKGLPGSRSLLPPMPWTDFVSMTDEDVKAIFSYLLSTKPVKNVVPAPLSLEGI